MDHDNDWERLARLVAGDCSPAERKEIERWVARDPLRQKALEEMQAIWARAELSPQGWDAEAAWRELGPRLSGGSRTRELPGGGPRPGFRPLDQRSNRWALGAAAAIAVLVGSGLLYRTLGRPTPPSSDTPIAMREYATPAGQRAEFNLSDGTHIMLSVASRLRVPPDYGQRDREVYLEGEAYFDVQHDSTRPFRVNAGSTVAEDLGTRFAVRSYTDDDGVQVVVSQGKVAFQGTELDKGQVGRITHGGTVNVRRVELDQYLAWTDGRLVFDNTPLLEALPQLSRWYDLDFRLGDSALATLPVTATFKNQPTAAVLELLALSLGVRQERHGRMVMLYPARPSR
jgi:transmembrane sensor